MNLAQLASYVCSKVRATDANSIALCKSYLSARFQMIWDSELWRDSLVFVTTTLDPANANNNFGLDSQGIWLLPPIADKVVAVRDHNRAYSVVSAEEYFQTDLDEFGVQGTAVSFYHLASCVAAVGTPGIFCQQSSSAEAGGTSGNVRGIRSDPALPAGYPTAFDGATNITNGAQALDAWNWSEITSFTKGVTVGNVSLGLSVGAVLTPLVVLQPGDTAAPKRCRIQLVETPMAAVNLRALVKRTMQPFVNDQDTPKIRGLDNALIAFAQADMLQEQRQYAKAQALTLEAGTLLIDAKKGEVYQQAASPRIVPTVEPPSTACSGGGFQWKGYW
jgi:hypothetical protein